MNGAPNTNALMVRLVLFLALPVVIWWVLELLVPLSMLITRDLFFPFVSHSSVLDRGFNQYLSNGVFVSIVAILTVYAGRRFSMAVNVGIFLGFALAASLLAHGALNLLGFPFHGDSP